MAAMAEAEAMMGVAKSRALIFDVLKPRHFYPSILRSFGL